jgi:methylmalonyl-CoA mutase N-terminal domain/subunit
MGYDSDEPIARGEVGKVGVAIDSVEDMRVLFDGLPLDEISTSMTINAPAATLLLMYQLVAAARGVASGQLTGTTQNDVLKEYIARGTYIYPPAESLRLTSDIFGYCGAQKIDEGARTVVGINKFSAAEEEPYEPLRVDPQIEADQRERLAVLRAERDSQAVTRALSDLRRAAAGTVNVLPPMRDALALRATGGEIAHAPRDVWGLYRPHDAL